MHKSTLVVMLVLISYGNIYTAESDRNKAARQRAYAKKKVQDQQIKDAQLIFGRMHMVTPSPKKAISMLVQQDRLNGIACNTPVGDEIKKAIRAHRDQQRKDNEYLIENDHEMVIVPGALSPENEQHLRKELRQALIQANQENETALTTLDGRARCFKKYADRTLRTSRNSLLELFPQNLPLLTNLQENVTRLNNAVKALQKQQEHEYEEELCQQTKVTMQQTINTIRSDLKQIWELAYQEHQRLYPQSTEFDGFHLSNSPGDQCDQLPQLLKCIKDYKAQQE